MLIVLLGLGLAPALDAGTPARSAGPRAPVEAGETGLAPGAAAGDSAFERTAERPDSSRLVEVPFQLGSDTTRTRTPAKRSRFDAPRWVMLRSLVVPGWGQLHNRAWFKAAAIGGGEALLGARIVEDERALRALQRQADQARDIDDERYLAAVDAYNRRLGQTVNRRWLLGGLLTYALLDAYVDAHFSNFDVEFRDDPALPEGMKPPGSKKSLLLRWRF